MSKVFLSSGEVIPVVLAAAAVSGAGFLLGTVGNGRVGVWEGGGAIGETGQLRVKGHVTMVKDAGTAWTIGQRLYWDDTAKNVTPTAASNTYCGWAYKAAGSADVSGEVVLESTAVLGV